MTSRPSLTARSPSMVANSGNGGKQWYWGGGWSAGYHDNSFGPIDASTAWIYETMMARLVDKLHTWVEESFPTDVICHHGTLVLDGFDGDARHTIGSAAFPEEFTKYSSVNKTAFPDFAGIPYNWATLPMYDYGPRLIVCEAPPSKYWKAVKVATLLQRRLQGDGGIYSPEARLDEIIDTVKNGERGIGIYAATTMNGVDVNREIVGGKVYQPQPWVWDTKNPNMLANLKKASPEAYDKHCKLRKTAHELGLFAPNTNELTPLCPALN